MLNKVAVNRWNQRMSASAVSASHKVEYINLAEVPPDERQHGRRLRAYLAKSRHRTGRVGPFVHPGLAEYAAQSKVFDIGIDQAAWSYLVAWHCGSDRVYGVLSVPVITHLGGAEHRMEHHRLKRWPAIASSSDIESLLVAQPSVSERFEHRLIRKYVSKRTPNSGGRLRYKDRIDELRDCATEDEIVVQQASVDDFIQFVDGYPAEMKRASLFLLGDGTLCAEWRGTGRETSLQFRGHGKVQCAVIEVSDRDIPGTAILRTSRDMDDCYAIIKELDLAPTLAV